MKVTLIITLFIGILLISSCHFLEDHPLFNKGADSLLNMPVVEPKLEMIDTNAIIPEESVALPVQTGYGDGKYFMIVGSFQNQNFAELYAEKIQEMGYQSQIIESSSGFYRVTAKSYNNFQQGVNEIDEFRSSITSGAWLHVR